MTILYCPYSYKRLASLVPFTPILLSCTAPQPPLINLFFFFFHNHTHPDDYYYHHHNNNNTIMLFPALPLPFSFFLKQYFTTTTTSTTTTTTHQSFFFFLLNCYNYHHNNHHIFSRFTSIHFSLSSPIATIISTAIHFLGLYNRLSTAQPLFVLYIDLYVFL